MGLRHARAVGVLESMDLGGVWVSTADGDRRRLSWDRVRALRGPVAADAEPMLAIGHDLWRARTRLERGDGINAEAGFERVLLAIDRRKTGEPPSPFGDGASETESVASEGLLRCRLRRGAGLASVSPWLQLVASDGVNTSRFRGYLPLAPAETQLIPALPPIWVPGPSVAAFAGSSPDLRLASSSTGTGPAATLGLLYRASAKAAAGDHEGARTTLAAIGARQRDSGEVIDRDAAFVAAIVGTLAHDTQAESELRSIRVLADLEPWRRAWADAAIGVGTVTGPGEDRERLLRGAALLADVRVRSDRLLPKLAGTALAYAAFGLERAGDVEGAARIAADLDASFPGHAALRWSAMQHLLERGITSSERRQGQTAVRRNGNTEG
ncbi:MAG: hypothetical protein AAF235_09220 [Planctomycetota bacterium]